MPAQPTEVPVHDHQWVQIGSTDEGYNCVLGDSWIAIVQCQVCGIQQQSAFREYDRSTAKGSHTWQTVSSRKGVCPGRTVEDQKCSVCGQTRTLVDGAEGYNSDHIWSEWAQQADGTQTRTCSKCQKTETKGAPHTHTWVKKSTAATCTTEGKTWEECSCGEKRNMQTSGKAAHKWVYDAQDCTKAATCSVCGTTGKGYSSHNFAATYQYDDNGHWRQCTRCSTASDKAEHTRKSTNCTQTGKCSVCGAPSISTGMEHKLVYNRSTCSTDVAYHELRCANANCNYIERQNHYSNAKAICGQDQWCDVCNAKVPGVTSNKGHTFGPYMATSSGHTRTCTVCGYVEKASHTGRTSGSGGCTNSITCSTCGYVISQGYSSHSFGVWMSNGSTHYRVCTHPNCTATESSAHTGGVATCSSKPVCAICGFSYGSVSRTNHAGGTELRNEKAAKEGVAGYTGDIYCLGCNKVLTKGRSIAALAKNHTHAYTGAWLSDSSQHWKLCSCGERGDIANHSFSSGKCSVCGAVDPNYKVCSGNSHVGGTELKNEKAAQVGKPGYTGDLYCTACGKKISTGTSIPALEKGHEHEYSLAWRSDSTHHWKDCTCGQIDKKADHTYVNGICSVCGAVDPNSKKETHVHTYGSLLHNGQYHWRVCSVCGFQAEKAVHVMLNDKCLDCGYEMVTVSNVKDVGSNNWFYEPVKKVIEAGILTGGKNASETKEFKPNEKVALSDVVDALYRLAGSPMTSTENGFVKVKDDEYYANALNWVADNELMKLNSKTFTGEEGATLEEMVQCLYHFAQKAGWKMDTKVEVTEGEFVSGSMGWAESVGLTEGLGSTDGMDTDSDGQLTRAEAATVLANFMSLIEDNGLGDFDAGVEAEEAVEVKAA